MKKKIQQHNFCQFYYLIYFITFLLFYLYAAVSETLKNFKWKYCSLKINVWKHNTQSVYTKKERIFDIPKCIHV